MFIITINIFIINMRIISIRIVKRRGYFVRIGKESVDLRGVNWELRRSNPHYEGFEICEGWITFKFENNRPVQLPYWVTQSIADEITINNNHLVVYQDDTTNEWFVRFNDYHSSETKTTVIKNGSYGCASNTGSDTSFGWSFPTVV